MSSTTNVRRLMRPPITEVVVDLRVALPQDSGPVRFEALQDALRGSFPGHHIRNTHQVRVELRPDQSSVLQERDPVDVHVFATADERELVQASSEGFTFNRLAPYTSWEHVRKRAYAAWTEYVRVVAPASVSRMAIRTINRIPIPRPVGDLRDWFLTSPDVASTLPFAVRELLMRVVLVDPETQIVANVLEASDVPQPHEPNAIPFIFDIDVYRLGDHRADGVEVWEWLERIREHKNRIFFESLTTRAIDLFK
ncbi:MAG: TIGR04255 family protein [Planctomycetota bacterium]